MSSLPWSGTLAVVVLSSCVDIAAPPTCDGDGCGAVDGGESDDDAAPASSIHHVGFDAPQRIPTGGCGATTTAMTERSYARYWEDDFTRSAGLPDDYFAVATEPYRINQEQQLYDPAAVTVDADGLHLTARRLDAPIVASDGLTYHYASGEVFTSGRANAAGAAYGSYGRWEVCASLPTARGSWPAIWLLANEPGSAPGNAPWPPEIDIMEHVSELDEVQTNVFWGAGDAPQMAEGRHAGLPVTGVTGFHQYAVEFDASHIDFYVDGDRIRSFDQADHIPSQAMYLILNLAVGGVLPSYRAPCDSPAPGTNMTCADGVPDYDDGIEMVVRYARRYD